MNTIFSNKEKNNKIIDIIDKKIQNFDIQLKENINNISYQENDYENALENNKARNNNDSKIILDFNENSLNARKYIDLSNKDDSSNKNTLNNNLNMMVSNKQSGGGKTFEKKKNKNITTVNDKSSTVIKRNPFL